MALLDWERIRAIAEGGEHFAEIEQRANIHDPESKSYVDKLLTQRRIMAQGLMRTCEPSSEFWFYFEAFKQAEADLRLYLNL